MGIIRQVKYYVQMQCEVLNVYPIFLCAGRAADAFYYRPKHSRQNALAQAGLSFLNRIAAPINSLRNTFPSTYVKNPNLLPAVGIGSNCESNGVHGMCVSNALCSALGGIPSGICYEGYTCCVSELHHIISLNIATALLIPRFRKLTFITQAICYKKYCSCGIVQAILLRYIS